MDLTALAFNLSEFIKKIPKPHGLEVSDWTVVVSGISIVLGTLIILILVFSAFGSLVSKAEAAAKKRAAKRLEKKKAKKAKKAALVSVPEDKAEPTPVSVPAPVPVAAPVVEEGISGEVVAAISAAVYSMEGSNVTIAAIRKQNPITARNPWAQAAVIDNTRPF